MFYVRFDGRIGRAGRTCDFFAFAASGIATLPLVGITRGFVGPCTVGRRLRHRLVRRRWRYDRHCRVFRQTFEFNSAVRRPVPTRPIITFFRAAERGRCATFFPGEVSTFRNIEYMARVEVKRIRTFAGSGIACTQSLDSGDKRRGDAGAAKVLPFFFETIGVIYRYRRPGISHGCNIVVHAVFAAGIEGLPGWLGLRDAAPAAAFCPYRLSPPTTSAF